MSGKQRGGGAARIAGDHGPAQAARTAAVAVQLQCAAEITFRCVDCGEVAAMPIDAGAAWPTQEQVDDAMFALFGFRDGRCECCWAAHVDAETSCSSREKTD